MTGGCKRRHATRWSASSGRCDELQLVFFSKKCSQYVHVLGQPRAREYQCWLQRPAINEPCILRPRCFLFVSCQVLVPYRVSYHCSPGLGRPSSRSYYPSHDKMGFTLVRKAFLNACSLT